MSRLIYLFFFLSGASGLIYQVIWVREFGNVFGNTIYSVSLVTSVYMCGLGVGSYLAGRWADRRYAADPNSLLRAYGYCELGIAGMGLLISLLLPHLGAASAATSFYTVGRNGWHVLSTPSYLARYAIALLLLSPVTLVMGATLTILIRSRIHHDLHAAGWVVGALYGINTGGAAVGCFLTDFAFVPAVGLRATQMIAIFFNLIAALGALRLAESWSAADREAKSLDAPSPLRASPAFAEADASPRAVVLVGVAIAMSGFAAMGMEIVWFRHLESLVGSFRSVFSLLLTVILLGICGGSLVGGYLHRRFGHAGSLYMVSQALFAIATLLGVSTTHVETIEPDLITASKTLLAASDSSRAALHLWLNVRPMVREMAIPALLMGFTFPLINAAIQRVERVVGHRAGVLYLGNTFGAVLGALTAGFVLLPVLGLQRSITLLMIVSVLGLAPLYVAVRPLAQGRGRLSSVSSVFIVSLATVGVALAVWVTLPPSYVIERTLRPRFSDRFVTLREGITEIVAVTEAPDGTRRLLTNGYSMSGTGLEAQRYMRAFAHIPLLSMDAPQDVLVICFGVGNTLHAASLHPSIQRLEVADLSRNVLEHADYFAATNGGVLSNHRLAVYVSDGRQHLRMRPAGAYDLITLEPPPIAHAGVASLYSREFYELVRSRLKPKGYVTQWLPLDQVPEWPALTMVRAFIDVFPRSVMLSGYRYNLILMGTKDTELEIDPQLLKARLASAHAVRRDLERIQLDTPGRIVGTFAASAERLAAATEYVPPLTDDYPILEYGVSSRLHGHLVTNRLVDVGAVASWCPKCFADGKPLPGLEDLGTSLSVIGSRAESWVNAPYQRSAADPPALSR